MSSESTSRSSILEHLAEVRTNLETRDRVCRAIRAWFHERDYLEVDTPLLLKTVATEEHVVPFPCQGRYLATSPELEMKQLMAAGFSRVFQFSRSFRQGESGRLHNPEFAILEWYRSGDSLQNLVEDLEGLLGHVARASGSPSGDQAEDRRVDFARAFDVVRVQDAFLRHAGWDPLDGLVDPKRFDMDLVHLVEPHLGLEVPTVLVEYPVSLGALAAVHPEDPRVALRAELYVRGIELANGFVELRDPREQRRRFLDAASRIRHAGRTPPPIPEGYLSCLPWLPPTVGMALGVDRLVMLMAGSDNLHDVLPFAFGDA